MSIGTDHNQLFEQFRESLDALENTTLNAMPYWVARCQQLLEDSRVGDRFEFLRWPSLAEISPDERSSLIYGDCYFVLKRDDLWKSTWFRITREQKVGHPKDFSLDFGTSPISVQHAYHLCLYTRNTTRSLTECDVIFEIGGGYGSFCRMLFNAGFNGLYLIYDLPHVVELQRLFLKCNGFDEITTDKIPRGDRNGFCLISDVNMLKQVAKQCEARDLRIGFVATWSLSETPLRVRDDIFPGLHKIFSNYLISFESMWHGIDNEAYFSEFCRHRIDLRWARIEIPGSIYLLS